MLIRTGRAALGQEQQREARRQDRIAFDQGTLPEPDELVLVVDQLLGPEAIPVVGAEESDAREPAGTLKPVEIVELPLLAVADVLLDLEVAGQPVDAGCRLRLMPPLPQLWIVSPWRYS